MKAKITKKGMKYVYPGRGVLEPQKKRKHPSRKKLMSDLSKAYNDDFLVAPMHDGLEGEAEDVELAGVIAERLKTGALPPLPLNGDEEAMAYRLLSDTWINAYGGTPKVLTQSKRTVTKLIKYWLVSEGFLFAARATAATWEIHPCEGKVLTRVSDEPVCEDFDAAFHYLDRPLPGFALLQELRLVLAEADDDSYREAVEWARGLWEELPLVLRAALVFLLPTEDELAESVIDGLEELKGTYRMGGRRLNLSANLEWHWPSWVGALAWSVRDREGFERLNAKTPYGGEGALGLACFVNCQEALPQKSFDWLVHEGLLEPVSHG